MPVPANEKAGLVEWVNSFGYGQVTNFRDLGDGVLIMKIVGKIAGHPVKDLIEMKKTLYSIITHKKTVVMDLNIKEIARKEETLHQLLEVVLLAIIDSPDKNDYVAGIMRLSSDTQTVMMVIMKRVMGMPAEKPKNRAELNFDDVDEMERELQNYKQLYAEREEETNVLKDKIKELQEKLRAEAHREEELLANTHANHEKELDTFKKQIEATKNETKKQIAKMKDENEILRQQAADLAEVQAQCEKLRKRAAEATEYKQKYDEMVAHQQTNEIVEDTSGEVKVQKLQQDKDRLMARIAKLDAAAVEKENQIQTLKMENQKLQTDVADQSAHKTSLESQLKAHQANELDKDVANLSEQEKNDLINKYKSHVAALTAALDSIKKQFVDYQAKTGEMAADMKAGGGADGSSLKVVSELQTKLMSEYQNTLSARESAVSHKATASELEAKVNEMQRAATETELRWKGDYQKLLTEKDDIESKLKAATKEKESNEKQLKDSQEALKKLKDAGAGKAGGSGSGKSDADQEKWRARMTNQYNSFKSEQQLISSVFHEIGLRYHQLLDEYKSVIKETGREDRLFFKTAA